MASSAWSLVVRSVMLNSACFSLFMAWNVSVLSSSNLANQTLLFALEKVTG